MVKYIVRAGTIRSSDGDVHFVSAKRLIELHGVDPDECIAVTEGFRSYERAKQTYPDAKVLTPQQSVYKREEPIVRKHIAKNRAALANLMAKLEAGRSQAIAGDIRQLLKILVNLEVQSILEDKESILEMLRKEAEEKAAKKKK